MPNREDDGWFWRPGPHDKPCPNGSYACSSSVPCNDCFVPSAGRNAERDAFEATVRAKITSAGLTGDAAAAKLAEVMTTYDQP